MHTVQPVLIHMSSCSDKTCSGHRRWEEEGTGWIRYDKGNRKRTRRTFIQDAGRCSRLSRMRQLRWRMSCKGKGSYYGTSCNPGSRSIQLGLCDGYPCKRRQDREDFRKRQSVRTAVHRILRRMRRMRRDAIY